MLVFNHVGKGLDFREEPLRNDLVIPHRWDKTVSSVLSYTLKSRKLRKDCTVFMTFPYLFISRRLPGKPQSEWHRYDERMLCAVSLKVTAISEVVEHIWFQI